MEAPNNGHADNEQDTPRYGWREGYRELLRVRSWPDLVRSLRTGGWPAVATYLGIALAVLLILTLVLKKAIKPTHLTIGALMVMLLYFVLAAFLLVAARLFVTPRDDQQPS